VPNALFRFDGGPEFGIGHVMRCRSLQAAFVSLGWNCWSAMTSSSAKLFSDSRTITVAAGMAGAQEVAKAIEATCADCLVVDHYALDAEFEQAAHGPGATVLVIDDLADRRHDCDLLLDTGPERTAADYAQLTSSTVRFLLGPRYALLRPEFAGLHNRRVRPPSIGKRLLITLGGADPDNVSERVLGALSLVRVILSSVLVVGPANPNRERLVARASASGIEVVADPPNLPALMVDADMAVAAGGTTCWELACLGVPTLVIVIAENQRAVARAMQNAGAATVIGDGTKFDWQKMAAAIEQLATDRTRREHMSSAGRSLIDGLGANRVAQAVAAVVSVRQMEMQS
jgi:UDP-2,4-diacetamido-2,4,6-trideoxy-beta-L-altropyranose hydrolase